MTTTRKLNTLGHQTSDNTAASNTHPQGSSQAIARAPVSLRLLRATHTYVVARTWRVSPALLSLDGLSARELDQTRNSCTPVHTPGDQPHSNQHRKNKSPQELRQTHDTVMSSTNEASQHGGCGQHNRMRQENHYISSASSADSCEHTLLTARGDTCQEGMVRHIKARFGIRGHPKQKTTQPQHIPRHQSRAQRLSAESPKTN